MIELINFINRFQELDNETERAIIKFHTEETYKKDEFIVEAGKICSKVIFIKSGLVRRFFIHDGQDFTIWIYCNNQMATSMPSFFWQKPAYEYLQACEDTAVYSLSRENEQLLMKYPLYVKFQLQLLRVYLSGVDEVNYRLRLMTAKEKYNYMLTHFPEIIQRSKLKHIASFLGVSQETLSRIRTSIN
ncbi:MAG: Crp/Fnr family transcriptional regulator [Prolixibacteraceae bacterium]|nr:Crp/Fnr family transcriptional regulator [Prolixibacteraceae bacterium]